MKVVIEMYTGASDEPMEVRELGVGDTFDDLSDQWSWFRVASFTGPADDATSPPAS